MAPTNPMSDKQLQNLFQQAKRKLLLERNIPDEHKVFIHTLKLTGYSDADIATLFGMQVRQVADILKDPTFNSQKLNELYVKSTELMKNRMAALATTILASISDEDLAKASLLQKTTSIAQLIDKSRLLEGKSTSNVAMAYDLVKKGTQAPVSELEALEAELYG